MTENLVRRRWRVLALVAALVLGALSIASAAFVVGSRLRSPDQAAADAAPPSPSLVTAEATLRELSEPVVLRGQIRPGVSVKLLTPTTAVGPSSVVTKVLVKKGDQLKEGRVLLERSGQPMIALKLPFPLYRDIEAGNRGPDVAEIQRALRRMGYRVTVTEVFDNATQRQVERFYRDRGYPTGASGDAPAGQQQADVDEANAALDRAESAGTGVAAAKKRLADARSAVQRARLGEVSRIPQASVLVAAGRDRLVTKVHARVGQVLSRPDSVLLELDGKAPAIVAVADRDQAAILQAGLAATAVDDLTGDRAEATVTAVGEQPTTGPDGQSGFQVQFAFTGQPIGGGVDRSLRIDVQVASDAAEVLAVPVTALYSRADGSTFVTVVPAHGEPVDVTVETGRIAGGWVEILEPYDRAIAGGVQVVVGERLAG
jgi:peptidoglycan hydrolase-like protein with peptidoglycan-binding domain